MTTALLQLATILVLAPLLGGVVTRVKAIFAGRTGAPLLQPYHDLARLLRKGVVYSRTAGAVFRAGPVVGLAATLAAALLMPFGGAEAVVAFPGDFVLLAYLLGLARFVTALAALDTGSSFEGMGASREVTFASFAEPALFLALVTVARATGALSLSEMLGSPLAGRWAAGGSQLPLVALALFAAALAESSRIPFDDPNTHLELTMVHEVMVLDHSGPDLALILYGAHLKLALLGALVARVALGFAGSVSAWLGLLGGLAAFAVAVGIVESTMARLRMPRVPQFLLAASLLSALALVLPVR